MRHLTTLALVAGLILPAAMLSAQDSTQGIKRMVPDSLVSKANISEDSARAIALHRVPGTVQAVELDNKRGHLMYQFQIQRAGRQGSTRVNVNALNGHVVSVMRGTAKGRRAAQRSS